SNRIYIYGDLSLSDELVSFLSDRFGFSFEAFPAACLQEVSGLPEHVTQTLPACLEVVAAVLNDRLFPNLLPPEQKLQIVNRRIDRRGVAVLTLLFMILGTQWQFQRARLMAKENELAGLQKQVASFKDSHLFNTYTRLKLQLQKQQQYVALTKPVTSIMGLNLKELSRLTPPSVRLYELTFRREDKGDNMHLTGVVTSRTTPPEVILAEYVELLKDSPFYENVKVTHHVKRQEGKRFRLDFNLAMRGVS
ncbi:MAG: hypothetical protein D6800_09990, partial [Candidatus Zixiibacteriota bacterium]